MLGAHPIEVALGSSYDRSNLKNILAAMADAGLAAFLCQTDSKAPAPDKVLAPATAKKMRADGHNMGFGLATSNKTKLKNYLTRWESNSPAGVHPNIGINVGESRLLVVDVDTEIEKHAFLEYWAEQEEDVFCDVSPTVLTPGQKDKDGDWIHKDGGHFYFTLPAEYQLPANSPAVVKMGSGWAIYVHGCYVLAPPSVRAEGPYVMAGKVREAPKWLLAAVGSSARTKDPTTPRQDIITEEGTSSTTIVGQQLSIGIDDTFGQDIDDWSRDQDWETILTDRGYNAYRLDRCGTNCMMYTAPGAHASQKSCTAHGADCTMYDQTLGHGPIHFWTDNVPDGFEPKGTYTLVQFLARADHDGNVGAALAEAGIDMSSVDLKLVDSPLRQLITREVPDQIVWPARHFQDTPAPEPLIEGFLFRETQAMLIGAPAAGKSFVALDMAGCIATGQEWHGHATHEGLVIYIAGEGFRGFIQRLGAWSSAHSRPDVWDKLHLVRDPYSIPADNRATPAAEWWAKFIDEAAALNPEMIVIDTLARVSVGLKENDASDMGRVVELCNALIARVSSTVMLVHHTSRGTGHARGSTALLGSVDTELHVIADEELPNTIQLLTSKQKDAEQAHPMGFEIQRGHNGSAYITELALKPVPKTPIDAVLAILGESGRDQVKVADLHLALTNHHTKADVDKAVRRLIESGKIIHVEGARGRQLTTAVRLV